MNIRDMIQTALDRKRGTLDTRAQRHLIQADIVGVLSKVRDHYGLDWERRPDFTITEALPGSLVVLFLGRLERGWAAALRAGGISVFEEEAPLSYSEWREAIAKNPDVEVTATMQPAGDFAICVQPKHEGGPPTLGIRAHTVGQGLARLYSHPHAEAMAAWRKVRTVVVFKDHAERARLESEAPDGADLRVLNQPIVGQAWDRILLSPTLYRVREALLGLESRKRTPDATVGEL